MYARKHSDIVIDDVIRELSLYIAKLVLMSMKKFHFHCLMNIEV